jgi:hypothetical protein
MQDKYLKIINEEKEKMGANIFKKKVLNNFYPEIIKDLENFVKITPDLNDLKFSEQLYCFLYNIKDRPKCEDLDCYNLPRFKSVVRGYGNYCSETCRRKNSSFTTLTLRKYGKKPMELDWVKEKIKETNIKKYGVECVFQSKNIKEKIKETNIKKYGVDNPAKSDFIKKLTEENNIKKYGVNSPTKLKIVKDKSKQTNLIKWGSEYFTQSKKYLDNRLDRELDFVLRDLPTTLNIINNNSDGYHIICNLCKSESLINKVLYRLRKKNNITICPICNPINKTDSDSERLVANFIGEHVNNIILKDRTILNGKEIDILVESNKIGFEYHGLYWHSEIYKTKDYHLNKTKLAESKGYKLIHVFEDEWVFKNNIVKSLIKSNLNLYDRKIYARKCYVKEIVTEIYKEFCENNHIQGYTISKIKLGLFYNEELVSVMSFGGLRKSLGSKHISNHYEMLRFCNKLNTTVVGGASKLFKYFITNFNPEEVISFADKRYFSGDMYKLLGFNYVSTTTPNYWYVVNGFRQHRFKYRKDVLVKQGFDKNKTEKEIMFERGYFRIWDCGNLKFLWKK